MAQKKPSRAIKLFGTEVPDGKRRELRAGPISAVFNSGALRYIRYHGAEVLRGIAYIVRDKDWGTYAPAIESLKIRQSKHGFFVAGELDEVVVEALRIEHGMRKALADLTGRKDREQRQHEDDRRAAQA